jgi:Xaa-Pro aminopeptidase
LTEIEQRRRTLSARLPELKIDALLVSSSANVRYLTGFTGSNGILLLTSGESHFFTDPRYALEASQRITARVHIEKKPLLAGAVTEIKRKRLKKIGFESSWLRFEAYAKLKLELDLHPVGNVIEEQRMVKSPSELDLIRRSVATNSEAYSKTIRRVHAGAREQDIAAELDYQMRALGAEKAAFDTIVAAGPRSALPHAQPTAHRLGENELLLIDMGASQDGYASDMTRVSHTGTPPKRILRLYKAVLEAQLAALRSIKPGITTGEVDAAARSVLKRHELDRAFVHSTGHGLGLEIHEPPRIARKDKTKLRAGMAITIEPGVYIDGVGGIRIEDTVLVTEHGCEVLTPTPKDFIEL